MQGEWSVEERFHKTEFHNKFLVQFAHARLCSPPIREEILSDRENRVVTTARVFQHCTLQIRKTRE